ncbi:hypothetical protein X797_002933 [Metarhizium robertsii]|uniref:Uncharacterized protein n=2 Tax=Metarhizium robertsii TaxID=568076 RepID=E9F3J4_METRA|nr:uncharacterized protein MAA_06956 [Metarhizium robertsii ARSEF 23]EFY97731.1 hypothetical protein MAA_06956 [Metarhizium robertsii ARSEF 23]EXV05245.1 hypothetical protein X797_002933 [Metarhizium robertsii]
MFQLFNSLPRGVMACNNVIFASLAYVADWNETHIYNPRWPPHAKFHNGQSMSFGVLSALTTIYLLGRRSPNATAAKDSVFIAAIVGSLTTAAGLSAALYPGTAWADPERDTGARIGPQGYLFMAQICINWIAYFLEKTKIDKGSKLQ